MNIFIHDLFEFVSHLFGRVAETDEREYEIHTYRYGQEIDHYVLRS